MAVAAPGFNSHQDEPGHFVRFYQADSLLVAEVARFASRAMHAGGRAIVIATQAHLLAIGARLDELQRDDGGRAHDDGRFVALDAEATLARFMVDGAPDEALFSASVGALVASADVPGGGPLHAFGEMVSLLCEQGLHEAAVRLEALWNELARRHRFTLFCAYPQALFSNAEHSPVFEHICAAHTHVLPSELLTSKDDAQAHRLIALWQQKAMALEREVERRNRAEATVRTAQRQRDALFMNAPVAAALLCGPQHVFELANKRFRELAGGAPLAGRRYAEVFAEADHGAQIGALLTRAFEQGEPTVGADVRIDMTRPDGAFEPRYFTFHFEPLRLVEQTVDGVIAVAVEVTEQVRARGRFEKSHAERERLVAELRQASRAKDEFLAMLGHELRNPLAPIVTALRLMRMRTEGDTLREQSIIARQVDHLVRLVDDLLDISRITRGKIELKKETVRVADVLANAVEMANFLLEHREHTLTIDVDPDLVWRVDATRLAQVVSNLLTNAARYTAVGGHIELTAQREPGGMIAISVRDNGIGLAPDVLSRVFELFFQGQRNLDRAEGGLGIGLALVKSLVEMHGGSVSATSAGVGRGSTFALRIPGERIARHAAEPLPRTASMAHGAAAASKHPPAGGARAETTLRAGALELVDARRVLLVDDNVDGLEALAELLKECGHHVEAASDPSAALQLARRFVPELAVIDIGLPVMDGYQLVGRLRAEQTTHGCVFVALTGYGQEADRHRSREAGFDHHYVKPLDPSQLLRLIEALPPRVIDLDPQI